MEPGQTEETGKLIALSYEEDDSEIDIQSEITYAKKCAELEFSELTEEEEAELLVGNLPLDVDDDKLATLFEQAGTVDSAKVTHAFQFSVYCIAFVVKLNSFMVVVFGYT